MKTHHLIVIAELMVLASSCCNVKEGNLEFSKEQKQWAPYKKNATCGFMNDKGVVVNLTVTEKKTDWRQADVVDGVMCGDYILVEQEWITLSNPDNLKFELCAEMNYWYNTTGREVEWDNKCCLWVYFWRSSDQNYKTFRYLLDKSGNFVTDNESTFFHESMEIGGKTYNNVVENRSDKDVLFYNKAQGVLKLEENGKDVLIINR